MRGAAATVLIALAACGGKQPATTTTTQTTTVTPAGEGCASAYAAYETEWRVALSGELASTATSEPEMVEDIIRDQLATLPNRVELAKLRTVYAVVDLFVSDAPWPRAFAAADEAIARCGERAKRPPG